METAFAGFVAYDNSLKNINFQDWLSVISCAYLWYQLTINIDRSIWYLKCTNSYLCIIKGFDFEQCVGSPSFILRAGLSNHKPFPTKGNDSLQFIINVFFSCALFLFAHYGIVRTVNIQVYSENVYVADCTCSRWVSFWLIQITLVALHCLRYNSLTLLHQSSLWWLSFSFQMTPFVS